MPRDLSKKSDWFRCKKISQKLKYFNFNSEQSERNFSLIYISYTTLRMSDAKIFGGEKCEWKSGLRDTWLRRFLSGANASQMF